MDFVNTQRILLMYAGDYEISDERGVNRGCTLNYFFWGDNGEALRTKEVPSSGPAGMQRAKCSIDFDDRKLIRHAPGIYDAGFIMNVGSDGKAVLKVQPGSLKYVGPVDFRLVPPDTARGASGKESAAK